MRPVCFCKHKPLNGKRLTEHKKRLKREAIKKEKRKAPLLFWDCYVDQGGSYFSSQ